jgi:hypothetical protein
MGEANGEDCCEDGRYNCAGLTEQACNDDIIKTNDETKMLFSFL